MYTTFGFVNNISWGGVETTIAISHLSKSYKKPPIRALRDVSFSFEKGETIGLLGPNGAGKTTLIKCVCGLIDFSEGSITVEGLDVKRELRKVLRRLGVVLDGARNLYWRLTVRQNLEYFGMIRGMSGSKTKERISEVLSSMKIESLSNRQVNTLSSGQKRKVSIAAALIHNPLFLILDEPTTGLDIPSIDNLVEVLNGLRETNIGMLISSHDLSFVRRVAQRNVFISAGRVVGDIGREELKEFGSEGKASNLDTDLLAVYRQLMRGEAK